MSGKPIVAAVACVALAAASFAGVTYTTTTSAEGRGGAQSNQKAKVWARGDGLRVEFLESDNPVMGAGTYIVSRDAGKTMFLVNPKEKTFSKWDMQAMMEFTGGMTKFMNMKVSNPKVEKLGEEPGPLVAGLPTTHYKFRTSYTMEMSFMGMRQSSTIVKTEEIWATPKVVEAALFAWVRQSAPKFGNDELDRLVRAEMTKVQGFHVKRVDETVTTDKKGKSQATKTTMLVEDVQVTEVADATFAIPSGYREKPLLPMGEDPREDTED